MVILRAFTKETIRSKVDYEQFEELQDIDYTGDRTGIDKFESRYNKYNSILHLVSYYLYFKFRIFSDFRNFHL